MESIFLTVHRKNVGWTFGRRHFSQALWHALSILRNIFNHPVKIMKYLW
jgi:hypothetical protein